MRFKEFKVQKEHRITPVGAVTPIPQTTTNPKFIDNVYTDTTKKQKPQDQDTKTDPNEKPLVDLIAEKKKRKKKKTKRSKLNKYFFPGYGYYGLGNYSSDSNAGDSGGGDGGGESVREGKVAPLYPLVIAGHPFNWNVYDLRNNKMVANVLGGDRWDSKLYEIRINRNGMTSETRMLPTYVLTAGAYDKPPYKAYELVAPEGGFGKVEKSPGPGGTTKLRPDQDDMLRHLFKNLGGGKYYGYDLVLVEKGLDQWGLIEKALGAKIMEVDTAMELGYTDWDPEDSSGIIYLGNKVNQGLGEEQDFKQFLNKALTNKVEPKLKKYDPNTTMGFHNMPGYKNALDFGMAVIGKMDDKTKKYYANKDEDVLLDYLFKVAKRNNLLIKEFSAPTDDDHAEVFRGGKFYEEDLFEVPGLFKEVFHDPNIGSSWVDLLKDNLTESVEGRSNTANEVKKFGQWACKLLKIQKPPKIHLSYNTKEAQQGHHTGRHTEGGDNIWVYANNRNLVDILRTVFHELVHWRQSELGLIKPGDSYPGSPIEAQADMLAGKYIKIYGKSHRNIFQ